MLKVIAEFKDGARTYEDSCRVSTDENHAGEPFRFSTNAAGIVGWSNDWCRVTELTTDRGGYFTTKFYRHLWGHTDYILPRQVQNG